MRITILTSLQTDWFTSHQINTVINNFDHVRIVAVDRSEKAFFHERIQAQKKLIQKRGLSWFIKKRVDSIFLRSCARDWNNQLHEELSKKSHLINIKEVNHDMIVSSVNGKSTEDAIFSTEPEILIQAGAGILKSNIFNIPSICTLNVHGAIAPKLRGGNSVFWSYYYGRPDWLGVTVHQIDAGIDTGSVFKRQNIEYTPGVHPAGKIIDTAIIGTDLLCDVISLIDKRDIIANKMEEESVYLGFYNSTQYKQLKNNNWNPIKTKI